MVFLVVLIAGITCWYIHHPNRPRAHSPDRLQSIASEPGAFCDVSIGGGTSLSGILVAIDHEAIILKVIHDPLIQVDDETQVINPDPTIHHYWIPKSSILLIKFKDHADI